MNKISIEHITHTFSLPDKRQLTAVQDTNLSVKPGELVTIIGRSGCGKTTLLNLVGGLLKPTSGVIRINGQTVTGPHYSRMMMFQQPCVLPWLTVEGNIAFGCKIRGEKEGLREKVSRYIHLIGLEGFEKVYPDGLSAGMMQRVALARSLIGEPEVLLMDEPFSDVDFFTRSNLYKLVLDLWQNLGLTVVLVTHDIEEALLLGQRVVMMSDRPGRIKDIFNIPLPYPRSVHDAALNSKKKEILERFDEKT
ncbi:MAG: ABC transporter ATP-binding protein [bacterium]|nr:ABC transporter ATP-binding protein [bacterium]